MGPGFVPIALGVMLVLLGLIAAWQGRLADKVTLDLRFRPFALIMGAIVIWVLLIAFLCIFFGLLHHERPCTTGLGQCRTISCFCGNVIAQGYAFMFGSLLLCCFMLVLFGISHTDTAYMCPSLFDLFDCLIVFAILC